ncbi:hypothetical protein [Thermococcus stetteri]|nr:hypothetical protein [Thermococcus stetteri]MBP1912283.1 endonuclease/exonuclease/phosphatase (EEP) superfamily protein YafD [Thermococcus stetteri]
MRIDYVFVKGLEVLSARRILRDRGLSDHFGVYSEVASHGLNFES